MQTSNVNAHIVTHTDTHPRLNNSNTHTAHPMCRDGLIAKMRLPLAHLTPCVCSLLSRESRFRFQISQLTLSQSRPLCTDRVIMWEHNSECLLNFITTDWLISPRTHILQPVLPELAMRREPIYELRGYPLSMSCHTQTICNSSPPAVICTLQRGPSTMMMMALLNYVYADKARCCSVKKMRHADKLCVCVLITHHMVTLSGRQKDYSIIVEDTKKRDARAKLTLFTNKPRVYSSFAWHHQTQRSAGTYCLFTLHAR